MSSSTYFEDREKAREMYTNMANTHAGIYKDIMTAELKIRGDNEEPLEVQM